MNKRSFKYAWVRVHLNHRPFWMSYRACTKDSSQSQRSIVTAVHFMTWRSKH